VLKLDDIRIITGCQLRLVVSTAEEIEKIRGKGYQKETESVDGILGSFDDGDVELKETDVEEEGTDLSRSATRTRRSSSWSTRSSSTAATPARPTSTSSRSRRR
jgi:hypothetical protein